MRSPVKLTKALTFYRGGVRAVSFEAGAIIDPADAEVYDHVVLHKLATPVTATRPAAGKSPPARKAFKAAPENKQAKNG